MLLERHGYAAAGQAYAEKAYAEAPSLRDAIHDAIPPALLATAADALNQLNLMLRTPPGAPPARVAAPVVSSEASMVVDATRKRRGGSKLFLLALGGLSALAVRRYGRKRVARALREARGLFF